MTAAREKYCGKPRESFEAQDFKKLEYNTTNMASIRQATNLSKDAASELAFGSSFADLANTKAHPAISEKSALEALQSLLLDPPVKAAIKTLLEYAFKKDEEKNRIP